MNTVKVNLEGNKSYIIDINNDLSNFNLIDKINKNCKIVIVTDTNVDFYYGDLKKFVLSSIALSIFCVLVSRIHILTFEKL
jgi:3-dehydroquinate synthetase